MGPTTDSGEVYMKSYTKSYIKNELDLEKSRICLLISLYNTLWVDKNVYSPAKGK